MFRRIRFRNWLVTGFGLAALAVPATALAGNHYRPNDDRYGRAGTLTKKSESPTVADGRSPDTIDAALTAEAALSNQSTSRDGVKDGYANQTAQAMEEVLANQSTSRDGVKGGWYGHPVILTVQSETPLLDGRSPDTKDAGALAHTPVVTVVESPGFQWGDFAIGGAAALASMILLGLTVRFLTNRQGPGQGRTVTNG